MKNKCRTGMGIGLGVFATVGALAGAAAVYYKTRSTIPHGAVAVFPFRLKDYLGKWYEIARMPMRYEKGMSNVTAEYSLNEDGSVKVVNSGYDARKGRERSSEGKAVPVYGSNEGMLKVSFFGPFYAGYNVVDIDPEYRYALVYGRNLDYMWILSREKTIPADVRQRYLEQAEQIGYSIGKLIWTRQE